MPSPYRISGVEQGNEITVSVSSTLAARLFAGLFRIATFSSVVGLAFAIAVAVVFVAADISLREYWSIAAWVFVVVYAASAVMTAIVTLSRSPGERMPRAITFSSSAVTVRWRSGDVHVTDYAFFARAEERQRGLRIVLQERPPLAFDVASPAVAPALVARLAGWFDAFGMLRRTKV